MHKITHSVMFHHFHDDKHLPAHGSLSSSDFIQMIDWLNKHYTILSANQYKENFENGTLKNTDICLSFDDALKCQYDIAVPVMERLGIQAFFFTHSSAFGQNPDRLEIYRYFRTACYADIDKFYEDFFHSVEQIDAAEFIRHHARYSEINYLAIYSFYTDNDRWFRYLRDQYLVGNQYDELMDELMSQNDFDAYTVKKDLWMSEDNLVTTESKGHLIGLHSYSHPTQMSKLSKAEQELEYQNNYDHLTGVIGKPIRVMSHPCVDYNEITLEILKSMEIDIGFRDNMSVKEILSPLEIPREDHFNVLKEMRI